MQLSKKEDSIYSSPVSPQKHPASLFPCNSPLTLSVPATSFLLPCTLFQQKKTSLLQTLLLLFLSSTSWRLSALSPFLLSLADMLPLPMDRSKILSSGMDKSFQLPCHQFHCLPEHISALETSFIFQAKTFHFHLRNKASGRLA